MTLISKTIKIDINHEKWLESHPEINFSEWARKKIDEEMIKEHSKKNQRKIKAIIVAAGHDKRLGSLTKNLPKCMLDVKGKTIIERQIENLKNCGINDIIIVKGYKQEIIDIPDVKYYQNPDFEDNGILYSLFLAEGEMDCDFIFLYSDIIFDKKILERLLKDNADISLAVDLDWKERYNDRVGQHAGEAELVEVESNRIIRIGKNIDLKKAHGEFIGLARFSKIGTETLKNCYKNALKSYKNEIFHESPSIEKAYFTDMIQEIIDDGFDVKNLNTYGDWMEIDTFEDYRKAWSDVT